MTAKACLPVRRPFNNISFACWIKLPEGALGFSDPSNNNQSMKKNPTALITALLLTLLMSLSPLVRAQDAKPRDADTINTDMRLKQLTTVLALTDEQKGKVRPIILEEMKGIRLLHEKEAISQERFAKEDEVRQASRAKIKTVLTPEQAQKFEDVLKKPSKKSNPKPK